MQARSLTDIPEAELVEILCQNRMLRHSVFTPFQAGAQDRHFLSVRSAELDATGRDEGDIDAILLPAGDPGHAVAYQFKRVKVTDSTFNTLMPGKLHKIRKAIQQANATLSLGFSRIVLSFLVVTDGRSRVEFNFAFRGPTGEVVSEIDRALDLTDLHQDIGVARVELTQPLDRDFTLAGGIGCKFLRDPARRDQSPSLTNALQQYAASHHGRLTTR